MADSAPAHWHMAVTVGQDLPAGCRALRFGTACDAVIKDLRGNDVTYKNIANGERIDIQAKQVVSATAGATDIVAQF